MKLLPTVCAVLFIIILMVVVANLGGCSLHSGFAMKCKGECEVTVERGVESTPTIPTPKGDFK